MHFFPFQCIHLQLENKKENLFSPYCTVYKLIFQDSNLLLNLEFPPFLRLPPALILLERKQRWKKFPRNSPKIFQTQLLLTSKRWEKDRETSEGAHNSSNQRDTCLRRRGRMFPASSTEQPCSALLLRKTFTSSSDNVGWHGFFGTSSRNFEHRGPLCVTHRWGYKSFTGREKSGAPMEISRFPWRLGFIPAPSPPSAATDGNCHF